MSHTCPRNHRNPPCHIIQWYWIPYFYHIFSISKAILCRSYLHFYLYFFYVCVPVILETPTFPLPSALPHKSLLVMLSASLTWTSVIPRHRAAGLKEQHRVKLTTWFSARWFSIQTWCRTWLLVRCCYCWTGFFFSLENKSHIITVLLGPVTTKIDDPFHINANFQVFCPVHFSLVSCLLALWH